VYPRKDGGGKVILTGFVVLFSEPQVAVS